MPDVRDNLPSRATTPQVRTTNNMLPGVFVSLPGGKKIQERDLAMPRLRGAFQAIPGISRQGQTRIDILLTQMSLRRSIPRADETSRHVTLPLHPGDESGPRRGGEETQGKASLSSADMHQLRQNLRGPIEREETQERDDILFARLLQRLPYRGEESGMARRTSPLLRAELEGGKTSDKIARQVLPPMRSHTRTCSRYPPHQARRHLRESRRRPLSREPCRPLPSLSHVGRVERHRFRSLTHDGIDRRIGQGPHDLDTVAVVERDRGHRRSGIAAGRQAPGDDDDDSEAGGGH
jgi:hypothetical protein